MSSLARVVTGESVTSVGSVPIRSLLLDSLMGINKMQFELIPREKAAVTSSKERLIPPIIWQTFKTNSVPPNMYKAVSSWFSKNTDCQYNFLMDDEGRQMVADFDAELLQCYDLIPKGAFRADIWRYCALYQYGGIYADMDTVCKYPMRKLVRADDQFVVAHDANPAKLFNAFMCSVPKHPVLRIVLDNIKATLLDADKRESIIKNPGLLYDITGPGGLALAVTTYLGLPELQEFSTKTYNRNNVTVRILHKLHKKQLWSRRVMVGLRTILMCKYPGYLDDLESLKLSHWKTSN